MYRNERIEDVQLAMMATVQGERADIWTALPGIIESFNAAEMTCEIQPTIQILYTSPVDGSTQWLTLPLCVDCPVQFPSGGGATLTFPVKKGDEALITFSARCIDAWWQQGGVQVQPLIRMHDLSDGFVNVGIRSQPRVLSNISSTDAQLRSDDGAALIGLNPTTHDISLTTSGKITAHSDSQVELTAPLVKINNVQFDSGGNIVVPAGKSLTAPNVIGTINVTFGGKSGVAHTHPVTGISTGSGSVTSGAPS